MLVRYGARDLVWMSEVIEKVRMYEMTMSDVNECYFDEFAS